MYNWEKDRIRDVMSKINEAIRELRDAQAILRECRGGAAIGEATNLIIAAEIRIDLANKIDLKSMVL